MIVVFGAVVIIAAVVTVVVVVGVIGAVVVSIACVVGMVVTDVLFVCTIVVFSVTTELPASTLSEQPASKDIVASAATRILLKYRFTTITSPFSYFISLTDLSFRTGWRRLPSPIPSGKGVWRRPLWATDCCGE